MLEEHTARRQRHYLARAHGHIDGCVSSARLTPTCASAVFHRYIIMRRARRTNRDQLQEDTFASATFESATTKPFKKIV